MVNRKGLGQANILRTNNNTSTGYGIVYADEVSGHRTVANLTALNALNDWQLSASGDNTGSDAIGQLWYVVNADGNGNGSYYQLKDWSKRKEAAGWQQFKSFNPTSDLSDFVNKDEFAATESAIQKQIATKANAQDVTNAIGELQDSIKNIAVTGGASTAAAVTFDNAASGMAAVTAQAAIDELSSKISEERTRVDGELDTLDSNISNIKGELHGTTSYNITVTFNSKYEYQTIDKITAGTKIKNNTNNGYHLYDKTEGTMVGSLIANSSVILEADITSIRIMGALEVTPFEASFTIGETKEGFIEKINKDIEELSSLFERNSRNKFGIIEYKEGYSVGVDGSYAGKIVQTAGFRITNAIPLRNNKGFNVSGATLNRLHFFSESFEYISSTDRYYPGNIPSNAVYCILQFKDSDNPDGYSNVRIDYYEDINNGLLSNTWFSVRENGVSKYTQDQFNEISKVASAIHSMSVNEKGLAFAIINTTFFSIILLRGSEIVARIREDNKKTTPEYIEFTQNGIIFKAWIDFSMLDGVDMNYSYFLRPILSNKANNAIIYKKEEGKEDFNVKSDFLKESVLPSPFTMNGYILLTDGTFHNDETYRSTDYISTDKILSIKASLPSITSGAGGAWYDADKVKLPTIGMQNNLDNFWQMVPNGAKYFRVSCPVDKNKEITVLQVDDTYISDKPTYTFKKATFVSPTTSKVVYSYKDFVDENGNNINSSRVELQGNGSGEQIKLGFANRIHNHKAVASVSVLDSTSVIAFGNRDHSISNNDKYITDIEVRISGSSMKVYKKGQTEVLCAEKNLSFTLSENSTYIIGYEKVEQNDNFCGSTTFFIKYGETKECLTFEFNDTKTYNGIRSDTISGCSGQPYFGLISGHVLFNNFFISSDYNPQAKVVIMGDSFVGANTLYSIGDMSKKYAGLLQNKIGKKDFVVAGKGGEEAGYEFIKYAPKVIDKFKPKYLIIALGVNNSSFETYKSAMEYVISYAESRGVMPILTTITPFNNDARKSVRNAVNSWVRNSGYLYVDICKAVTNEEQDSWKSGYVMSDNIHPTAIGHQAIFDTFCNEIPEIFEFVE